jgi:ABC-type multidrug transport system fused ATPase/permease subunit
MNHSANIDESRITGLGSLAVMTGRSHKKLILAMLGALTVLGLAQACAILLVKNFLGAFFDPRGNSAGPVPMSIALPVAVLVAGLAKSWGTYLYTRLQQEFSMLAGADLRDRLFPAILGRSWQELATVSPGTWMSVLVNDVAFVQTRLSEVMTSFLRGGMSIIASLLTMLFIHWPSAIVMMVLIPFMARATGSTGKRIAGFSNSVQQSMRWMADLVLEVRARFDFMRAQQGEKADLARFDAANDSYFHMIIRSIFVRSAFAPALEFLGFAIFAIFIFTINRGWISFGNATGSGGEVLLQFVVALGFMVKPLREIGEQLSRYHETRGALSKCFDLVNSRAIVSQSGQFALTEPAVSASPVPMESLRIRNVSFRWQASGRVFRASDVVVSAGNCIAIVGPSGAGKSTFLKILSGLLPPDEWDSTDSWDAVSQRSSLVPQQPFLFTSTIRENVAYGFPAATPEMIWAALDTIDARAFVASLPGGIDTPVSSLVANLSGGQVQRLVIARALLRGKPILLLDEATSALDVATEGAILRRLVADVRATGKAMIAVTHRLQCLPLFDEIWFVDNGDISMRGKLDDLLANDSFKERFEAFCREPGAMPS